MPFDISAIYHPEFNIALLYIPDISSNYRYVVERFNTEINEYVYISDISGHMYLDEINIVDIPIQYRISKLHDNISEDEQYVTIDTNTPKMFPKISGITTQTSIDSSYVYVNIRYPMYNNADKYQIFYTFDDPTFEQNIYQTEGINIIETYNTSYNIRTPINQYKYLYFKIGIYSNLVDDLISEPSTIFKVNLGGDINGITIDDLNISYNMLEYINTNNGIFSTKDGNTYKGGFMTYYNNYFSQYIIAATALRNQIYTINISGIPSTYKVFLGISTANQTGFIIKIFDESNRIATTEFNYEVTLYTKRDDNILNIFRRNASFDKYIQIGQATATNISIDFTNAVYYRFTLTNNSEYRLVSESEKTTLSPISMPSNATSQDIIDIITSSSSVDGSATFTLPNNNTMTTKIEKDPSGVIVTISKKESEEKVFITGLNTDVIIGTTSSPTIYTSNINISYIDPSISSEDAAILQSTSLSTMIVPISSFLIKLTNNGVPVDIGSSSQPNYIGLTFNKITSDGRIVENTKVFIARQKDLSSPIEIIGSAITDSNGQFSINLDNNSFITIFTINQPVQTTIDPSQQFIYSQYLPRPYINDRSAEPITERKSQTTIASNYNAKVAANMNIPQFKSYDQYIQYKLASAYNCRCSF